MAALPSTSVAAPNLGVTAGSTNGGTLTQGAALPNITTTQQTATAAPQFYTCYLNQLATQGHTAAQCAAYVGAQPLQAQAFQEAGQNAGNYTPALNAALNTTQGVAGQCISNQAQSYMSPYIKCVVNSIGNLGEANINANLAPQTTAGIVGSGQFGSARGAQALGQTIANAGLGITAQQACALEKGYTQALCTAKAQNTQQLQAGAQLGNLAGTTQSLGVACENALATLGAQCQTIKQNQQLFPMSQLTSESALLRGYTVPTSTSSSTTGPGTSGQYQASPLQQIAGLGALAGGISNTALGKQIGSAATSALGSIGTGLSNLIPTSAACNACTIATGGNGGGGAFTPTAGNSFNIGGSNGGCYYACCYFN